MSFIPTSLVTDGVLNAEGCDIINAGAVQPASVGLPGTDDTGSPGTVYTINTPIGAVRIPAGQSTVTVHNSLYRILDFVALTIIGAGFDATLTRVAQNTSADGTFTIVGNATATAPVDVMFCIINCNPSLSNS